MEDGHCSSGVGPIIAGLRSICRRSEITVDTINYICDIKHGILELHDGSRCNSLLAR